MPVDLSRVGLEGIETAQRTLNSIEARRASGVQTAIAEGEFQLKEQERALDQWATSELSSIAAGDGTTTTGNVGSDDDYASMFDRIGMRYMKAGAPKRGKEMIEAGVKYRKDLADLDKADDDQEKVRLDNMITAGGWVAQNIGENESEYALFLSQLDDPENPVADIIGRENVSVLKNTPWTPELANFFKSKALSIKDQATLAMTERGHRRLEESLANTESYRKALLDISQGNLEERRRTETRMAKVGGAKASNAPTGPERDSAHTAILNNVKAFDGVAPLKGTPERTALDAMTDDVASRAKQIVTENKGLTFSEAVEQAVAEAETAGDFGILEPPVVTGWLDLKRDKPAKTGYKRKGTSNNPLPLPTSRSELIPGRYYKAADGTVEQYKP